MIGKLRGRIQFVSRDQLIMDVHGVGYLVSVPASTAAQLVDGNEGSLLIYTQVREDAIVLYGFATSREKEVFELANTVSGIGPKLALSVLSTLSPDSFCQAILAGNLKKLTEVPGIGKRTGERLIVELKDKVAKSFVPAGISPMVDQGDREVAKDALEALLGLGYSSLEAETVLSQLQLNGTESTEAVIRKALGFLVKVGSI